jgi:hypothetical protein
VSPALEAKLKELEQRQRTLKADLAIAETVTVLPDRKAIHAQWQSLVNDLESLPGRLTRTETETAKATLKGWLGEVRVDRSGKGYAELCLQRLVAGVGFGFSFPAHNPPRRSAVRASELPLRAEVGRAGVEPATIESKDPLVDKAR